MRSTFLDRARGRVLRALVCVAALTIGAECARAANIAGLGTGIIGQTADPALNGVEIDHAGSNTAINDNNTSTHVDNFPGGSNSYVGVTFASPQSNIQSVGLIMALFTDGGWFGPSNTIHNPLTPADLTPPTLQITTDGVNWTNVAASTDYSTVMNGNAIGGGANPNPNNSALSTFTLSSLASGVEGIRLLGNGGGVAGNQGFIGVSELTINQVPEPTSILLLGVGAIGLFVVASRRRSA